MITCISSVIRAAPARRRSPEISVCLWGLYWEAHYRVVVLYTVWQLALATTISIRRGV